MNIENAFVPIWLKYCWKGRKTLTHPSIENAYNTTTKTYVFKLFYIIFGLQSYSGRQYFCFRSSQTVSSQEVLGKAEESLLEARDFFITDKKKNCNIV